jgi:hypothetical protein
MDPAALPFWFKQRQAKLEPAGDNTFKVTAPNQNEAFLSISRGADDRWSAAVRLQLDGSPVAATEAEFATPELAWNAAFELYRRTLIT